MAAIAVPLIAAGIGAAGSAIGGALNRHKPSGMDKQKKQLIDDLLASVRGNGSFNDLFSTSDEDFQKRYAEPMKNLFNRQIAPQIQQSYIYGGQQNGTGLEDTLTRAGVSLDDMINQQYMQYQEGAQNRKASTIGSILGSQSPPDEQSIWGGAGQGILGHLSGGGFDKGIDNILKSQYQTPAVQNAIKPPRAGFTNDQNSLSPQQQIDFANRPYGDNMVRR